MNVTSLLFGAGSVGPFASRVFLPAFVTALLLRFGVHLPWVVTQFGVLGHVPAHHPVWFTSDAALIVLGTLAALEIFGQKTPEIRNVLHEFDLYLKPALALLTTLGVMSSTDSSFVRQSAGQAGMVDGLVPLAVAVATWRVARARQAVASAIYDHLDGTHLDHLLNWAEDGWAAVGPVVLVLFPVLMLAMTGVAVGALAVVRRRLTVAEHSARVPCPACGTAVFPSAVACPNCRRLVDRPAAVGFLGLSKPYPAADPVAQPFALAERRRCPVCATHLPAGWPRWPCPACGDASGASPAFAQAYAAHVSRRLPKVLVVTFVLGLIPVVGLIAGTVYYRAMVVLPFAQYLPGGRRFLLRWGVRVLFLVLAFCQVIPLLGAFVVPVMAIVSCEAYRRAYLATAAPASGAPSLVPA